MRILFVSTVFAPHEIGGAEMTVRSIAEELAARGNEVVVVSLAPDGVARTELRNGVRCYYLRLANVYWPHTPDLRPAVWKKILWQLIDSYNPVMAVKLGRVIAHEKPDVISMHNLQGFSVSAWHAARRRGVPVVQTTHDYYLACTNSTMYRNGRKCAAVCAHCRILGTPRRVLSNIPASVTAVSRRTLTLIERAGLFGKVKDKVIIHNPIGKYATPAPRRDRRTGEVIRFGFLGRIEAIKGLDLLLEAMRHVSTDRARLLIGGRAAPTYMEHLRRSYSASNVEFLGFVDPERFFSMIDVLVVPSVWEEPITRVTMEGMAYGVPTVAARVGGLAEIVDEGETGWLFPAGDAAALAAILQRIVSEGLPAVRMSRSCRKRSADFEFPVIFDQYLAVLRRAAGGRAAGEAVKTSSALPSNRRSTRY